MRSVGASHRGLIASALAASLALAVALGPGASAEPGGARAAHQASPAFAHALSRVISVRVHHTRISTVQNANARRIGRSIATLRPTWVTGTLRYARNQYPTHAEARAWREIRRIVHRQSPSAGFDIVLNATQYRTPAAVRTTMGRLRAKLGPEGWFFDFFSTAFRSHPRMIRAAIKSAHHHGEWVGGNVFGITKRRPLPARADFWSVQDAVFHLNLPAVRRMVKHKPVLYHLQNDPARPNSGGCKFIKKLSSIRRRALIRRRAAQSARIGFHVSYPVLFPECIGHRPDGPGRVLYSYNAFRDPLVGREIGRLLDRYERAGPAG